MGALTALQRSPGALLRNPVVLLPVLVIGLFQLPQLVLQSVNPFLAGVVSVGLSAVFLLLMPLFAGGLLAMADEALGGRTDLGTFVAAGTANYLTLLVAYLLLLGVNLALGLVLLLLAFVGGALVLGQLQLPGVALGAVGLFIVLFVVVFLVFVFFVQFYGQAIVLDGERAVGGIKRSYRLVRSNLMSTLGYTVIAGVVGGLLGLGLGGLSFLLSPQSAQVAGISPPSLPVVAGLSLVAVLVGTAVGGFLSIYSVAFYRELGG